MAVIIGKNTIGGSTNPSISSDTACGCKLVIPSNGIVNDINVYTVCAAASSNMRFGIYTDVAAKPTSQVWVSPSNNTVTSTPNWYQEITSVVLTKGTYWFYYWVDDTYTLYYDAGLLNQTVVDFGMSFPTWENPFDSTNENFDSVAASIYITFTPDIGKIYHRQFVKPALFKPGNSR